MRPSSEPPADERTDPNLSAVGRDAAPDPAAALQVRPRPAPSSASDRDRAFESEESAWDDDKTRDHPEVVREMQRLATTGEPSAKSPPVPTRRASIPDATAPIRAPEPVAMRAPLPEPAKRPSVPTPAAAAMPPSVPAPRSTSARPPAIPVLDGRTEPPPAMPPPPAAPARAEPPVSDSMLGPPPVGSDPRAEQLVSEMKVLIKYGHGSQVPREIERWIRGFPDEFGAHFRLAEFECSRVDATAGLDRMFTLATRAFDRGDSATARKVLAFVEREAPSDPRKTELRQRLKPRGEV